MKNKPGETWHKGSVWALLLLDCRKAADNLENKNKYIKVTPDLHLQLHQTKSNYTSYLQATDRQLEWSSTYGEVFINQMKVQWGTKAVRE